MSVLRVPTIFANIGRGTPSQARRALSRLRRASTRRTIVALAEITARDGEKAIVRDLWPRDRGWQYVGLARTSTPLIIGPGWVILERKIIPITPGIPRYTSPLHLVEAVIRPRWRPWAKPVVVTSTHFVAQFGSWQREYERYQGLSWTTLGTRVAHHQALGRPVISPGDYNVNGHRRLPIAHRGQVQVWRRGLDACLAWPTPGQQVRRGRYRQIVLGIEPQHRGHVATIRLIDRRIRRGPDQRTKESR